MNKTVRLRFAILSFRVPLLLVASVGFLGVLGLARPAQASPSIVISQNSGAIGRYDVYELTLTGARASYRNPWDDVTISAVFTGPSGQSAVGGFYYDSKTWKVRFAPEVIGNWTWNLVFSAPDGTYSSSGSFTVTISANSGFLRVNPAYTRHLYTEGDNKVFYPIGFNECISNASRFSMDGTGFDKTDMDTYFDTYSSQGKNNYFWAGPGNCAISLYAAANIHRSGKNTYDIRNGKAWDAVFAKLHADGYKSQMEFFAFKDSAKLAPNFDLSNAAVKASVLDYHQYVLNRYGAYVDVWELCNEERNVPQAYLDAITGFLKARDPYHHPVTISYDQPQDDVSAFAVGAGLHGYYGDTLATLDQSVSSAIRAEMTPQNATKPLIGGETGNRAPNGSNIPGNYRVMLWTYNLNQVPAIFWNGSAISSGIIPDDGKCCSNMYIGPQQRLESAVFSSFIAGFDPAAQPLPVTLVSAGSVRAYVLGSAVDISGYFVNPNNFSLSPSNARVTGARVSLNIPASGMNGQWIDPSTGDVLGNFSPFSGQQTLSIPSFDFDIALRIRSSGT